VGVGYLELVVSSLLIDLCKAVRTSTIGTKRSEGWMVSAASILMGGAAMRMFL
jgi:hypothetical protein